MLADQLRAEYENRFVWKREYTSVLKFDPGQPRDEQGQWVSAGATLDKVMEVFGDDWMAALEKLHSEGATPFVLAGQIDLKKLAKTPAYASIFKYDPAQPRDEKGRWSAIKGRMDALKKAYPYVATSYPKGVGTFDPGDPSNLEEHTSAVAREWETQLTEQEMAGISERFGSDVEKLMQTAIPLHDIGKPEAIESGVGKKAQHQFTIPVLQDVLQKEGFSQKDIALATELMNHDLIGALMQPGGRFSDTEVAGKIAAKAQAVGMAVKDYATLQMAFYQADAAAYPFITRYMHRDGKKWSFRGSKKIAAIEALTRQSIAKFDESKHPRDAKGRWTEGRSFTSDEGYDWHENGPGAEWAKKLPYADTRALSNYSGFGYHDINDLRRGTYTPRTIGHFVRAATEEEYNASKVMVDEEYLKHAPHPFARRPEQRLPSEPYGRVLDEQGNYVGHIESNIYYKNPAGDSVRFSVQRAGPDVEAQAKLQKEADQLDDLIANRGLTLTEPITVLRGAYLPGVTPEDLQDMELYSKVYEEKGFTSTFLGDAEGRARGYPALGKWESIHNRFGSSKLVEHQDEVGTAVQFHITLPAGTKVASIESVRRLRHDFPYIPDPNPRPADVDPKYWMTRDYTAQPTVNDTDLHDKSRRSESEILIGSGAKFKVKDVHYGYTYQTGDDTLKPVKVYQVGLEYIGGGSSEGKH